MASNLKSLVCPLSVDSLWFSFFGDVDLEVGALEELKHKIEVDRDHRTLRRPKEETWSFCNIWQKNL